MKNKPKKAKQKFQIGVDVSMEEDLREYREKRDEKIMQDKIEKGEVDPKELQRIIEEE